MALELPEVAEGERHAQRVWSWGSCQQDVSRHGENEDQHRGDDAFHVALAQVGADGADELDRSRR
jgi:hypothetical protein